MKIERGTEVGVTVDSEDEEGDSGEARDCLHEVRVTEGSKARGDASLRLIILGMLTC